MKKGVRKNRKLIYIVISVLIIALVLVGVGNYLKSKNILLSPGDEGCKNPKEGSCCYNDEHCERGTPRCVMKIDTTLGCSSLDPHDCHCVFCSLDSDCSKSSAGHICINNFQNTNGVTASKCGCKTNSNCYGIYINAIPTKCCIPKGKETGTCVKPKYYKITNCCRVGLEAAKECAIKAFPFASLIRDYCFIDYHESSIRPAGQVCIDGIYYPM
ncbi:MAG: hypothetical protein WC533_00435 [Candidatus Pacearchaeota archaeon]